MKTYVVKGPNAGMRYHDLAGDDTPILFIHGLGCASSFDFPQVAATRDLASHRRILVDLLGTGFSDKPDEFGYSINDHADYLVEFIDALGVGECVLYGHSMGGSIAISAATRMAGQLKALILSEATLDSGGGFYSRKVAGYSEVDYLKAGHAQMIRDSLDESNPNWAASLSASSPRAISREALSLVKGSDPSWRELLYSLKIPRTYIFGELSLPRQDYEELQQKVNVEIVKNAGHSMMWENPEGLAAAIKRGIDRS